MAIVRRGQSQRRTRLLPLPATDDRIEETCLGIGREREMPGSNSGFEVGLVLGVTPIAPSGAWLKRLSSKTALVKNRSRQKQRWPDRGFPRPGLNVGDNLLSR